MPIVEVSGISSLAAAAAAAPSDRQLTLGRAARTQPPHNKHVAPHSSACHLYPLMCICSLGACTEEDTPALRAPCFHYRLVQDSIYLDNIANSVLVGPNQLVSIHRSLQQACAILDMAPPELYVRQVSWRPLQVAAVVGEKIYLQKYLSTLVLQTRMYTCARGYSSQCIACAQT
jgi:hypothetical protein